MSASEAVHSLRRHDRSLLAKIVAGFWALHLVYRWSIAAVSGSTAELLDPALGLAMVFGFLLSLAFCAVLRAVAKRGLVFGLGLAALLSLPVSLVFASAELAFHLQFSPQLNGTGSVRTMADGTVVTTTAAGHVTYRRPGEARGTTVKLAPLRERVEAQALRTVTGNTTGWYFFYFGLGSFFVGMSSAARLQRAERRAAEYERLAQDSQLRALRYQINPHFLFNTLNSLSTLIMTRQPDQAESMILNLSAFFRSTLAIEPTDDITLREEIALQRLYLDIESARFPDRLRVAVDIPESAITARVPALLLQPLVENAIKYGVTSSQAMVWISIAAAETEAGSLKLVVENNCRVAGGEGDARTGTGIGLRNVGDRLRARFGDAASCVAGFVDGGLYRVTIVLPLVRA